MKLKYYKKAMSDFQNLDFKIELKEQPVRK